ncbi:MAG: 50S ribosomal protein L10 [Acidobacteriota bacterium]
MTRSDKEQAIASLQEKFSKAQGMFFTDFTGITVEKITELRRDLRKAGIEYLVVKNTLAKKALEQVTGYDKVYPVLKGATAIAFSYDDAAAPAKILQKFREKNEKLISKLCVMEGQVYDGNQLSELAKIPSRSELIASILGSLDSPVSGVVGTINAVMRDVVGVIEAIEKQKAA